MTKPVPATASTPAWAHGLSDREQRFVLEYLVDLNLRAATARAGLGKTPASAGVIARKMRDKPAVAEAIAKLMQERHGLQASRIVSELGAFSYSRLTDYMEVKDGQLTIKDSASWREEMKSAVSEIRETRDPETGGSILRLKLHDKIGALDRLGKSIGLFKEKSECTVRHTVEVVDPLARIKARLASLPRATVDGADVGKGPMEKREYEAYGLAVVESEIHGPLKLAGAHALNSRPHAQAKFKRQPGRGALARKQIRHCVRASVRDCRRRSISRLIGQYDETRHRLESHSTRYASLLLPWLHSGTDTRHRGDAWPLGPKPFVGLRQGGIGGRLDSKLDSSEMRRSFSFCPYRIARTTFQRSRWISRRSIGLCR